MGHGKVNKGTNNMGPRAYEKGEKKKKIKLLHIFVKIFNKLNLLVDKDIPLEHLQERYQMKTKLHLKSYVSKNNSNEGINLGTLFWSSSLTLHV